MSRHALAHGCEGVARDLVYEAQHPFAELAEEGLSNSWITCSRPADHGWRELQELGVHQCLCSRRHGEAGGEQRYGADERAGPAIAHSHRATVGSGHESPHDPRDHQLEVRSGFTWSMRDRASWNLHSDRTRHELLDHLGWHSCRCDFKIAARTSASTVAPYDGFGTTTSMPGASGETAESQLSSGR